MGYGVWKLRVPSSSLTHEPVFHHRSAAEGIPGLVHFIGKTVAGNLRAASTATKPWEGERKLARRELLGVEAPLAIGAI
jgi:hypothetical protein